jgi:hypothetical protein
MRLSIFSLLLFSFPLFAEYSPPYTPGTKVTFQFDNVDESKAFYESKCDSNNFSWHGMDNGWFCAVGDPTNIVCIVDMTYDATDVNNCQNSGGDGGGSDGGGNTSPDPYFSPEAEFYGAKSLYEGLKRIDNTNSIFLPEIRSEIINGSGAITSSISSLKNSVTFNGSAILATNNRLDDMMAADRGALTQLDSSIYSAQTNIVDAINNIPSGSSGGSGDADLLLDNLMPMLGNMTGILSSIDAYSGMSANGANTFLGLNGMLGALIPEQSDNIASMNANLSDIKNLLADGNGGDGGNGSSIDYDKLINGIVGGLSEKNPLPAYSDTQGLIDGATAGLDSKASEFMDDSHFGEIQDLVTTNIFGDVANFLPSGAACVDVTIHDMPLGICEAADRSRPILFFVFAFLTFIYLRNLFFKTVTPTAGA